MLCDANRKLLVFLIDGFRYDYMDDLQNLAGFREIVETVLKWITWLQISPVCPIPTITL